jgi:hypothetical protein
VHVGHAWRTVVMAGLEPRPSETPVLRCLPTIRSLDLMRLTPISVMSAQGLASEPSGVAAVAAVFAADAMLVGVGETAC